MNLPRVLILYALLAIVAIGAWLRPPPQLVALVVVLAAALGVLIWLFRRHPHAAFFMLGFVRGLMGRGGWR